LVLVPHAPPQPDVNPDPTIAFWHKPFRLEKAINSNAIKRKMTKEKDFLSQRILGNFILLLI
jgi:hypothetical protein